MPISKGTYANLIDERQIADDVKQARSYKTDFIIVSIHFGTEYERYPNEFQTKLVAFLFSEGVDIIFGSHHHVLQPFELKSVTDKYAETKPRLVIYSLGNFLSNQRDRYCDGGIIFNATLEKYNSTEKGSTLNITDVNYIPTLVYVNHMPEKNQFFILPVPKYLKNDQPLQLPDDAYQKMLTFYKDTQAPLSPVQTQEKQRIYLRSFQGG